MSCGVARTYGLGPYTELPPVLDGTVAISPGDILFRDSDGYDKPVSLFTWDTNLATTQAGVKPLIRGVSSFKRVASQTVDGGRPDGMILTDGHFEFDCAALAAAAAPGDLVTFAKASGNALENQKVVITDNPRLAFAVVVEDAPIGATTLRVRIRPALTTPPVNGGAKFLQFPVTLASIANGDVVTGFTMPEAGVITGFNYTASGAKVTTASKTTALNLEIGTTDVTGGVLTLTSAGLATLGTVVSSTAITGANEFERGDLLSIEASGTSAFSEGSGVLTITYETLG